MLFTIRAAGGEDAAAIAELYARSPLAEAPTTAAAFELMTQTGHAFLLAESNGAICGAVRYFDEEGIGWFDLLVSARPWAGVHLVRAVQRGCQDRGLRLVRCRCSDTPVIEDYFARLGFLPIGRSRNADGEPELLLERRLPLLTVREQRRSDAEAIGDLTGEDPWVFEQGARPGAFVASDGDRVVGFIQCSDAGAGVAVFTVPALDSRYRERGLEAWMVRRAASYAETNGFHTAEMPIDPAVEPASKALEDAYWVREGNLWRRIFFTPKHPDDDWEA